MKIKQIAVHAKPHLDELVGVWLLRNYGEEKIPGVSTAKIVVWGKRELANTPADQAAFSGVLLLGLGGGMFDDHVGGVRTNCSATLVAKHLGLSENPLLKRLLADVLQTDSQAEGPLKALADEVQNLNRYWVGGLDLDRLYLQIEPFIVARVERQREYLAAKDRVEKCYHAHIGKMWVVAADNQDNTEFQHVARARHSGAIIVQRNSAGLTQILGHEDLDMMALAVRIRKAELVKSDLRPRRFLNETDLSKVGTLSDIPHWYFEGGLLLNGSESFSDVPPSNIDFREVVHIVEKHLKELVKPALKAETNKLIALVH